MATFSTVSRELRVRFSYKPLMVFLVYSVKYQIVDLKNRVRFPKTPKSKAEKITVVVYSPWTREVAGSPEVSGLLLRQNAGMAKW